MAIYFNPPQDQKLVMGDIINYTFTENFKTIDLPPGEYQVECWGASGGGMLRSDMPGKGGLGGYAKGNIKIASLQTVYMYVGGRGKGYMEPGYSDTHSVNGWNGGGTSNDYGAAGGGGATDIRLVNGPWNDITSLRSRIIVAGGGGGANDNESGGGGGGLTGCSGASDYPNDIAAASGGTQTSGGIGAYANGGFGYGGASRDTSQVRLNDGGGGGGGWYGGGRPSNDWCSGAGGSSFISGMTGCNAVDSNGNHTGQPNHYSGMVFDSTVTTPSVRDGDGFIKITVLTRYNSLLARRSDGIVGWRGENSHQGYRKFRKNKFDTPILELDPVVNVNYTGAPVSLTLSPGKYKMECWGASGGWGTQSANPYGKGGYTYGEIDITQETTVWLYIGRKGSNATDTNLKDASFNGGGFYVSGYPPDHTGGGGGGASDIRLVGGNWNDLTSLRSRIMVAAGGGGGQSYCGGNATSAGHGGGLVGTQSYNNCANVYRGSYANGGSQTAGGTSGNVTGQWYAYGGFGYGANSSFCGAGGGGGYYGGGSAYTAGGGGGSSFVSGMTGCNAINSNGNPTGQPNHYSGVVFKNGSTTSGVQDGDGSIKITLLQSYLIGNYLIKDQNDNVGWRAITRMYTDPVITTISLPDVVKSIPYSLQLEASGGDGTYAWSATGLPDGITLDPKTGIISGTPGINDKFNIEVTISSKGLSTKKSFTLNIPIVAPIITNTSLDAAQKNVSYSMTLSATEGNGVYDWSETTGIPDGLLLDPVTGVISGTPTVKGTFNVVAVAKSAGFTTTKTLSLLINPAVPVITTESLPGAQIGSVYSATLVAIEGNGTYTWSATGLPTGLTINETSGVISGTPTTPGTVSVIITVSSEESSFKKTISMIVLPAVNKGELISDISTSGSFKVPDGVEYVSINWIGEYMVGTYKSHTTTYGCAVRRIPVQAGMTYSNLNSPVGDNSPSGANYWAGYYHYCNISGIGNVPCISSADSTCICKVYVDDGSTNLFIDDNVRNRYKNLNGGILP